MARQELPFTKTELEKIRPAPQGKRVLFYDTRVPHLAIRVSDKGVKTFIVYKWVENRPVRRTIGKFPETTVEQARNAALEINVALRHGTDPLDARRLQREELSLGELYMLYFEQYLKERSTNPKESIANFKRSFSDWWPRKLSTIKKIDVQTRVNKLAEGGHYHRANRAHDDLRAVFGWGIKKDLFDKDNPAIGIDRFRTKSRERFIGPDEFKAFMESLASEKNEKLRSFLYMSLFTGARQANVLAMRWNEIDFELGIWTIPKTKNGDSQTIPLTRYAMEVLQVRKENEKEKSAWVFPGTGDSGHLVEPKTVWRRVIKRAGLSNLRMHDLRRTLGSYMAMTNQSLHIIGRALGHRSATSTQVYARLANDPVRQGMEKAQREMLSAAGMLDTNVVPLKTKKTKKRKLDTTGEELKE